MRNRWMTAMAIALISSAVWAAESPQFVLMQNPDSPFVTFRFWIKAGSACDPLGKEGVACLTGAMIGQGSTRNNPYEAILRKMFPLAASYEVQVDREMTVLLGTVHKDNLAPFYALLKDALLAPAFSADDFNRLKTDQANYIETSLRYSSDEELGKAVLHSVAFEGTSYAHPEEGLVQPVKALTIDDVKAFYSKYYTRSNITVGIAGGFTDELVAQIRKDIDALPAGVPAQRVVPAPPKGPRGLRVVLVEKDTRSTAISFGHRFDLTRASDDFYPLMIANSWLGEHRNSFSHLYQVMREARGLNYGDYSYLEWFPMGGRYEVPRPNYARHAQMFEVWIRPVTNEARHFALRQAVREVGMLVENGMTPETFGLTQNYLLNYCLNYAPTESYRLGYGLDDMFYGLPESHLDRIQKRVKAAALDQVNAALKKHIDPGNFTIVIVTKDAEALRKALIENATSPMKYDSPTPESILAEDKVIQDYKLQIAPENIRIIPISEVFEK
ncbi:MAG: pitrilysin family protein [Acidobacteriota bacterium]